MLQRSKPEHDSDEEERLVRCAIEGDADAFGVLYTRHLDAIYRYVYFRVGSVSEAEDLTEEVFTRAWEAMPRYRLMQYPFKSWLYRIAHNLVADYHRKRKPLPLPDPDLYSGEATSPGTEKRVEHEQDVAALATAVQRLNGVEQEVIILRFVEGLSHREVAKIIGKSEGASRTIQHRALARLGEYLRL